MAKRRRSMFAFARCGCFGGQAREKSAEDDYPVKLHVYDLSQGVARQLSMTNPGKAIQAIWHTGVVVYGKEYYFGKGIQQDQPGNTPYGTPVRIEDFGVTHVPKEVFESFLQDISQRYTPATYNLLSNNCNKFSNEAVQFLVGSTVPSYIFDMPSKAMNSPIGAFILPMIQGLETALRAGAAPQPPQFRPAPAAVTQTWPSLKSIQVQPRSISTNKMSTDKRTDDGSEIIPPTVQPGPTAATQTQPSSNSIQIQSRSITSNEMSTNKATDDGSRIIPPTVQPAPAAATLTQPASNSIQIPPRSIAANEMSTDKATDDGSGIIPPTVQPAPAAVTQMQPSSNSIQVTPRSITANEMSTDKATDDGSGIIPPMVEPAPAAATRTQPSSNSIQIPPRSIAGNEMSTDKATDDGSGIIPPTVQPAPEAVTRMQPSSNDIYIQLRSIDADKTCADKTMDNGSGISIPPTAQAAAHVSAKAAASPDPLREAKNRVQEEIKQEFAAIMATGAMQAGEAAALATRRVMARYGLQRATASTQQR